MKQKTYQPHPYADLFPMMTAAELEALTADIAENGLRQSIIRYQDLILDGRNRLKACLAAKVDPRFEDFTGNDQEALALVESLNVQRRDLTAGQRAIVAARVWGLNGYSKGGRPTGEKPLKFLEVSLPSLAKRYKTNQPSIIQARDLLRDARDLADLVAGGAPLSTTYDMFKQRQKQLAEDQRQAARARHYEDAIAAGEMTMQEAMKKIAQEEESRRAELQARGLWFEQLGEALQWARDWVGNYDDERLRWIVADESLPCPHSRKDVQNLITAAERILDLVVPEENGHHDKTARR